MKSLLKHRVKKYFPPLILFLIILIPLFKCKNIKTLWLPYYNYYFTKYAYSYPAEGEDFVISTEPHGVPPPLFLKRILELAFPNRKIIINDNIQPHLIIRYENMHTKASLTPEYLRWNAPYISVSAERWSLSRRRYRLNGPPLAEFVSSTPKYSRQLYFPFIAWCGLTPERIYKNHRKKFVIYVASNCVKQREKLFNLFQEYGHDFTGIDSLGSCSNTANEKLAGSWDVVEQKYSEYNFAFAMENRQIPGYMTEKILAVFRSGAIPIYWGDSQLIEKYFNSKALVDVAKFSSLEEAAKYIINLNADPQKVEQMRNEPIFKGGVVPEIFRLNDPEPTKAMKEAAGFIEKAFATAVSRNKKKKGQSTEQHLYTIRSMPGNKQDIKTQAYFLKNN